MYILNDKTNEIIKYYDNFEEVKKYINEKLNNDYIINIEVTYKQEDKNIKFLKIEVNEGIEK